LLRSYAADLRSWAKRLAAGYGIALALLVGGVLALFAAIAVGITALFHFLERLYGVEVAYGAIGGGLLVLAIILLLAGWMMLRRKAPPLPQPRRQLRAAKQILVEPAARRVVRTKPVTRVLVGAAATLLVGSILGSRFQTSRRARSGGQPLAPN
jgi:H+/Cl- antiporter ClcA